MFSHNRFQSVTGKDRLLPRRQMHVVLWQFRRPDDSLSASNMEPSWIRLHTDPPLRIYTSLASLDLLSTSALA